MTTYTLIDLTTPDGPQTVATGLDVEATRQAVLAVMHGRATDSALGEPAPVEPLRHDRRRAGRRRGAALRHWHPLADRRAA